MTAINEQLISTVRPLLDELRGAGLYVSDAPLYQRALVIAGE